MLSMVLSSSSSLYGNCSLCASEGTDVCGLPEFLSKLSFNPGKRLWVMFEKILSVYSFITTDAVANIFFIHRNSPEF